ncbi:MAG: aldo/keto reductase [Melioribacteraceae bacterium]|nr:aldo/keto reductase [Melioribacteraceae bacterium]
MPFNLSRTALGLWRARKWNYSTKELENLISRVIDVGITTFDHADIYGDYECEVLFGEVLKSNSGLRTQMKIVTKCGIKIKSSKFSERIIGHYDTSKEHIISSVDKSLVNLNTDFIDLLLIHRPDPLMNADEVAEAFTELKSSGKVLDFGVSNFLPHHFDLLQSRLSFPLVTNQIEVSVLHHEHFDNGNIDFLQEKKISPMVWSPFAGGRLFNDGGEQAQRTKSMLSELQNKYGTAGIESIATAWLFIHPVNFIVVLGSGNIDRIKMALDGMNIKLTKEDWFRIWVASRGQNVP